METESWSADKAVPLTQCMDIFARLHAWHFSLVINGYCSLTACALGVNRSLEPAPSGRLMARLLVLSADWQHLRVDRGTFWQLNAKVSAQCIGYICCTCEGLCLGHPCKRQQRIDVGPRSIFALSVICTGASRHDHKTWSSSE